MLIKKDRKKYFKLISVLTAGVFISFTALCGISYSNSGNVVETLKTEQIKAAGSVAPPSSSQSSVPRGGIVVNCGGLNVRMGPGTDYPIIGGLVPGAGVQIIEKAGDWWKIKYNGGEAYVSGKYIDTNASAKADTEASDSGTGVVTAQAGLNVRSAPWGNIETAIPYGTSVDIVGKAGDWYKIKYNGKISYVYAQYIDKNGSARTAQSDSGSSSSSSGSAASGDLQQRIVSVAQGLVGSTSFRGAEVDGGNLACAQVASTILKRAGAVDSVVLNVHGVINLLKNKGWKEVSAPPFQPGDVITWKTYDSTGDGVKDPDTHVGVIENGTTCVANSSSKKMPSRCDAYFAPISRVLRKV